MCGQDVDGRSRDAKPTRCHSVSLLGAGGRGRGLDIAGALLLPPFILCSKSLAYACALSVGRAGPATHPTRQLPNSDSTKEVNESSRQEESMTPSRIVHNSRHT